MPINVQDPEVIVLRLDVFERALLVAAGGGQGDIAMRALGRLLGRYEVQTDRFDAMTKAVTGHEMAPCYESFAMVLDKLLTFVGDDGRFCWPENVP